MSGIRAQKSSGKVFLVGAGPGDPGLLTLRAKECLERADVVVYDHLAGPEILKMASSRARLVFAGKFPKNHVLMQTQINRLLVREARRGGVVVRLKGGDPFLFGRGGEEAEALAAAGIGFEVVPGVTSAVAVPAYAGIPLTHRRLASVVHIATGHEDPRKSVSTIPWGELAGRHATLVILMGVGRLRRIVDAITAARPACRTFPAAVIQEGTGRAQKVVTGRVDDIAQKAGRAGIRPPAVVVIGRTVALRKTLNWFVPPPALAGWNVLVTRPKRQGAELLRRLKAEGAAAVHIPLIDIVPEKLSPELQAALNGLNQYDWLVFTSANSAALFRKALAGNPVREKQLAGKRIAAIGPGTAAELARAGLKPRLVPEDYIQEALGEALSLRMKGKRPRVLLVQTAEARTALRRALQKAGCAVDPLSLYRAHPAVQNFPALRQYLKEKKTAAVTLTSSSCARALADVFTVQERRALNKRVVFAAIGPVTARAARGLGLHVPVVAEEFTVQGLAGALAAYARKQL
jgi:uroporphyrinogen III methyltransferase/synthase